MMKNLMLMLSVVFCLLCATSCLSDNVNTPEYDPVPEFENTEAIIPLAGGEAFFSSEVSATWWFENFKINNQTVFSDKITEVVDSVNVLCTDEENRSLESVFEISSSWFYVVKEDDSSIRVAFDTTNEVRWITFDIVSLTTRQNVVITQKD